MESGEWKEMLPESVFEGDLNTRLRKLVSKAPVMLFMKGNPSTPKCGFSNQIVNRLNSNSVEYET